MKQSPSQKYNLQIRSQQRQKIFREHRKKLQQARLREDAIQIQLAQKHMQQIFQNHQEQFEYMMEMADKLEREQLEYQEYLAQLEEESINFQMQQRKKDIQELKKQIEMYFQRGDL